MPMQTQTSSVLQRFGGRIAAANAEHKDKPLDLGGFKRLPKNIRNGIGKLHTLQLKHYGQDEKRAALRGQEYLHVVGVVMSPLSHNGEEIEGSQMFQRIPICDVPANPQNIFSKPKSLEQNWFDLTQFFLSFGIGAPPYDTTTDPTGEKIWAHIQASIVALMARPEKDRYYNFTTRGWTPPATPNKPKPDEIIIEDWGKQCEWNGVADPGAGVTINHQPDPMQPPPNGQYIAPTTPSEPFNEFAPGIPQQDAPQYPLAEDVVAAMVELAMTDKTKTETIGTDAANAAIQLQEAAWANGWTEQQTAEADDWTVVGDMALNPPTAAPTTPPQTATATVVVGGKHKYAKRTKDGMKLKDAKGQEFPAHDVEITSVDAAAKTCTVKTVKDGKEIMQIGVKPPKPVAVKFEWLE